VRPPEQLLSMPATVSPSRASPAAAPEKRIGVVPVTRRV